MRQTRNFKVCGFRFSPKDAELFCHYLYGKIKGTLSPIDLSKIKECNLYGQDQPWTVYDKYSSNSSNLNNDLYFFTKLKKKTGSKRFDRTVGTDRYGTWSGEDKGNLSEYRHVDRNSGDRISVQGFKKRFRYENRNIPEQSGCWIMHEYSLPNQNSDWVLCRLRKNCRAISAEEEKKAEAKTEEVPKNQQNLNLKDNRILVTYDYSLDVTVDDLGPSFNIEQLVYNLENNNFETGDLPVDEPVRSLELDGSLGHSLTINQGLNDSEKTNTRDDQGTEPDKRLMTESETGTSVLNVQPLAFDFSRWMSKNGAPNN